MRRIRRRRRHGDLREPEGAGMSENRWTLTFTGDPTVIGDQAFLDRSAPAAAAAGVDVILSLFPAHAQTPDPPSSASGSATLPPVPDDHEVHVGNEVNATRFWSPQHTAADPKAGPDSYEATLAQCYDVLKEINPNIEVIGMGLAPRSVDLELDPAARLHPWGRRRIQGFRPPDADHGRTRRPSVPEPEREAAAGARQRQLRGSRLLRDPAARPGQAGRLRRIPRDGTADDADRPQARDRRDRLPEQRERQPAVHRHRVLAGRLRDAAGRLLRAHRQALLVRPDDCGCPLLPPDRREEPERLTDLGWLAIGPRVPDGSPKPSFAAVHQAIAAAAPAGGPAGRPDTRAPPRMRRCTRASKPKAKPKRHKHHHGRK